MRNIYNIQDDVTLVNVWHRCLPMAAVIDTADLPLLEPDLKWYAQPIPGGFCCRAKLWDGKIQKSSTIGLHQVIMGTVGQGRSIAVVPLDGDLLNCRRSNLVVATHRDMARARLPAKDWEAHDARRDARERHARELRALRQVREQFGYSRQYIWQVWKRKEWNAAILDAIDAALRAGQA